MTASNVVTLKEHISELMAQNDKRIDERFKDFEKKLDTNSQETKEGITQIKKDIEVLKLHRSELYGVEKSQKKLHNILYTIAVIVSTCIAAIALLVSINKT